MSRRTRCLSMAPRPSHGPFPCPGQPKSTHNMDSRCLRVMGGGGGGGDAAESGGCGGGGGGADGFGSYGEGGLALTLVQ
eukprot:7382505-Prymnesium_polylepis.1